MATIPLPRPQPGGSVGLEAALELRRSVREFSAEGLNLDHVSQLVWAAQGVTRKGKGRTAPSAGAHYPLELYVVAGDVVGLDPGTYHYHPKRHDLEQRSSVDLRTQLADAALQQTWMAAAPLVIVAYILTHTSSPSKQSPPIMEAVSPMLNVLFKVNPDVRMVT